MAKNFKELTANLSSISRKKVAVAVAQDEAVLEAIKAAKELEAKGISARVLDMHTIKPLDVEAVTACINDIGKIFVMVSGIVNDSRE